MGAAGVLDMSARHALRTGTQAVHERLHHLPAFAALAAGTLDRDAYVALLARLHGFHKPIEAELAPALDPRRSGLDASEWQRAHLLEDDLAALGALTEGLPQLPRASTPPSLAAAMGSLYVLVGSTLGGRVLARRLGSILPSDSQAGRTFLLGSAQPGHVGWSRLCDLLDRIGREPVPRAEMLDSAVHTFGRFERWFMEPIHTVST